MCIVYGHMEPTVKVSIEVRVMGSKIHTPQADFLRLSGNEWEMAGKWQGGALECKKSAKMTACVTPEELSSRGALGSTQELFDLGTDSKSSQAFAEIVWELSGRLAVGPKSSQAATGAQRAPCLAECG